MSRPVQKLHGDSGTVATEGQHTDSNSLKEVHSSEPSGNKGRYRDVSLQGVIPSEMTVSLSSSMPSQKLHGVPSISEGQQNASNI